MQLRASREENELEWLGEFERKMWLMAFWEWFESAWAKKVEYPTFSGVGPKDVSKKHKRKHKAERNLNNWSGGSMQRWGQSLETSIIIYFSKGNCSTAYYIDLFIEVLDTKILGK